MLTSPNLWLLCGMYFCLAFGWYFNITYLPDYLTEVYGVSKQSEPIRAGLLAGAPLLLGSIGCLVGGLLTDAYVRRTGNRKWGRRIFGIIGQGLAGVCLFACIFTSNVYLFVLAIALASFFNDLTMGAAWASCLDIGRKYSGIVSGFMNTCGNLGGFVAGIATGRVLSMLTDDRTLAWNLNFASFGFAYMIGVILWCFFDANRPLVDSD